MRRLLLLAACACASSPAPTPAPAPAPAPAAPRPAANADWPDGPRKAKFVDVLRRGDMTFEMPAGFAEVEPVPDWKPDFAIGDGTVQVHYAIMPAGDPWKARQRLIAVTETALCAEVDVIAELPEETLRALDAQFGHLASCELAGDGRRAAFFIVHKDSAAAALVLFVGDPRAEAATFEKISTALRFSRRGP